MNEIRSRRTAILGLALGLLAAAIGCGSRSSEVVVYCALDREFAEPRLAEFERATGVKVRAKYDVESTKTVGLAEALLRERARPRCDLFWNNEILHTLRLEREDLLEAYAPPTAAEFPADYRSPAGRWHGFAARARVLLVNTQLVPLEERPRSVRELADPRWAGRCGLAKPLFGTTATHAAVLFSAWGDEEATAFFRAVRQNAQVLAGNKQVAMQVGAGRLAFGLTDTDDAVAEIEAGRPVAIVFPDQDAGPGTLFIPNTLALIRGGPNPATARRLVDFLLTPKIEAELARGPSAQVPVHPQARERSRVLPAEPVRWMRVDFAAAAARWNTVAELLAKEFATGD